MKRGRFESWFSIVALLGVIGLAFVAQGLRGSPEAAAHSVASTEDNGRRGFFLLLRELGYAPIEWRSAPGSLPHGEHLLWLPQAPKPWKPRNETARGEGEHPNLLPGHALANYTSFVEDGGTLVAPLSKEMLEFLTGEFGLAEAGLLELRGEGKRETRRVRLDSGEQLELSLDLSALVQPLPAGSPWREVWILEKNEGEAGAESLAALECPLGAGHVLLLSEDAFLDNAEIGKQQHALAGVRLVEQLSRGGQLLFDEYCLGTWEPESLFALAGSPRVFLLTVHSLLLLALFIWALAWARAFPRDPPALAASSPLERAQALARIWRSSGREEEVLRRAPRPKRARKSFARR